MRTRRREIGEICEKETDFGRIILLFAQTESLLQAASDHFYQFIPGEDVGYFFLAINCDTIK